MPICPICKKWFEPLGFMRHRQMHREDRASPGYRHNGVIRNKRHQCSVCGRTRKECLMIPTKYKSNFGHQSWICAESECQEKFSVIGFKKNLNQI